MEPGHPMHVGVDTGRVDDALDSDGVGFLLVALGVAALELRWHIVIRGNDGDAGCVDGDDYIGYAGNRLGPGGDGGGLRRARLVKEFGLEESLDGGADLCDKIVTSGDAEAKPLQDESERLAGLQPPHRDSHARADGDGGREGVSSFATAEPSSSQRNSNVDLDIWNSRQKSGPDRTGD